MGEILQALKRIQAAVDGLVMIVHHTGKDSSRGLRGHSSLLAAMDAVIEVTRDGDRRQWSLAKCKGGPEIAREMAAHLKRYVQLLFSEGE